MKAIRSALAPSLLSESLMFHRFFLAYILVALQFLLVSSSEMVAFDRQTLPHAPITEAQILLDSDQRISDDFHVPPALIPRVAFWFDIYSKYGSQHHIIHHQDYPWWILEVVDTTETLAAPANAQWLNVEKANKMARAKLFENRVTFQRLARKVHQSKPLNENEQLLLKKMELLPGGVAKNLDKVARRLRLQTGQRDFYLTGLKSSTRYLEYMEKIFVDRGLPRELTRLPLVESSFNEEAGSKVGALGIWQLMPAVSRKFISVSNDIDERKSPYKATTVAARIFQENYRLLSGNWPLVVTAYNHGPGSLRKAVKVLGTDDIGVIISNYKADSFGFASENFYSEFLAALIVQSYSHEVFGEMVSHDFNHVDQLNLPRKTKIRHLVSLSHLSNEEFISYNPDLKNALRHNLALPKGFIVFFPSAQMPIVLEGLEKHLRVAQK